jgi:hypothetical protein
MTTIIWADTTILFPLIIRSVHFNNLSAESFNVKHKNIYFGFRIFMLSRHLYFHVF